MASLPLALPVWRRPTYIPACHLHEGEVDLLVIGAGYQGLSTALHAAELGLSVQVIDARSLGAGASGVNGGQVIPGLKHDPGMLSQLLGEAAGQRLTEFSAGTADVVFDLIARKSLDVEHQRRGWIMAAHTQAALDQAVMRKRQWRMQGGELKLLSAADTAMLTGADCYCGGWLNLKAGVINPLAFVHELARLASEAGVGFHFEDPVIGLRRVAGRWLVGTDAGRTLKAKRVLVATNAYSGSLVPNLAESLVWLHSFQIATAPLPPELGDQILAGGQAVSDSRRLLVYYRRSPDGRLIFGGRGPMRIPRSADDWAHIERQMLRVFPALRGIAIDYRWFGRVAMTADGLPHLHEPEPGLMMVAGCQGRGIALMTALGAPLAAYAASGDPTALPLPISPLQPIPFHRFKRVGIAARIAWYRLLDGLEH